MAQCIIIYLLPITLYKCRNEQEQGTLWLVEVGNNLFHDLIVVPWGDDDLCAGMQGFHIVTVQIV